MISSGNSELAEYFRLRAPKEHGYTLQLPPLIQSRGCIESNESQSSKIPSELAELRHLARCEVIDLAKQYSDRYLDADIVTDSNRIVMSGHQPTLFHPGVWFKNWALGSVAKSNEALAINLVVDNDLCSDSSVLCPQHDQQGNAKLKRVRFDRADAAVPFEMRRVVDDEMFASFGNRLAESIRNIVANPLVEDLWPEVMGAASLESLPARIAAGRHRLERSFGLQNLELPISLLASTRSFASFAKLVVEHSNRLIEIHNNSLLAYRKVNRVRSQSHPVPKLESEGSWNELPFWVWTKDNPRRRRLFSSYAGGLIQLTDRENWSVSSSAKNFVDSFQDWNRIDSEAFIRPRALTTTMFSRLFASDLFLHGIGGAKYDQLNDQIIRRFFDFEPPRFMTLTATMKLPIQHDAVTEADVAALKTQLRSLRYHPELQFPDEELTDRKRQLLVSRPQSGSRKVWHDEIESVNQQLFSRLSSRRNELESLVSEAKEAIPSSKIFGSREFSFALFPRNLVEDLRAASALEIAD